MGAFNVRYEIIAQLLKCPVPALAQVGRQLGCYLVSIGLSLLPGCEEALLAAIDQGACVYAESSLSCLRA